MLENLFRFLFKYPPLLFQQGDFSWGLSRPVLLAVMVSNVLEDESIDAAELKRLKELIDRA